MNPLVRTLQALQLYTAVFSLPGFIKVEIFTELHHFITLATHI